MLACTLALLLFARGAHAATYFVCPMGGSDNNDGRSAQKPWKSWQKAEAVLGARQANESLVVNVCRGGTVTSGHQFTLHPVGYPRTVQAYTAPGSSATARPILSGVGIWGAAGLRDVTFDGLEFRADAKSTAKIALEFDHGGGIDVTIRNCRIDGYGCNIASATYNTGHPKPPGGINNANFKLLDSEVSDQHTN